MQHYLAILFIISGIIGCNQQSSERHYTEIITPIDLQEATPPSTGENVSEKILTWITPKGWKEELGNDLRLVTFRLENDPESIDCSIVSLAGEAGGVEANLRRWIGQLNINPTESQISQLINTATVIKTTSNLEGRLYDFNQLHIGAPKTAKSMRVAMIPMGDLTFFVKLSGTIESINANKENFLHLIRSLKAS